MVIVLTFPADILYYKKFIFYRRTIKEEPLIVQAPKALNPNSMLQALTLCYKK